MKKYLFIKVTKDKYELPLYVADGCSELAKYEGKSANAIYSSICHYEKGICNSQYRRICVEGDDL